jgi:hypothetical protein
MGFFDAQTKTVDLGDGNSVVIRKLTYGENLDCLSRALTQHGHLDSFLHARHRLRIAIVSWQGTGFEGREVNPKNIDALPIDIARKVNDALAELNKEVTEEEGN